MTSRASVGLALSAGLASESAAVGDDGHSRCPQGLQQIPTHLRWRRPGLKSPNDAISLRFRETFLLKYFAASDARAIDRRLTSFTGDVDFARGWVNLVGDWIHDHIPLECRQLPAWQRVSNKLK